MLRGDSHANQVDWIERLFWISRCVSWGIPDRIGCAHAGNHSSKDGVSSVGVVEVVVVGHIDVELGACAIQRLAPGHAEIAKAIVKRLVELKWDGLSRPPCSPCGPTRIAISRSRISCLDYGRGLGESVPYEIIIEVLVGEVHEVADGLRSLRPVELDDDGSIGCVERRVYGSIDYRCH